MSDNDTDTNGGMPPKISLKAKIAPPQEPAAPKLQSTDQPSDSPTPKVNAPGKPIALRKPSEASAPTVPTSPIKPVLTAPKPTTPTLRPTTISPKPAAEEAKQTTTANSEEPVAPKAPTTAPKPIAIPSAPKPAAIKEAKQTTTANSEEPVAPKAPTTAPKPIAIPSAPKPAAIDEKSTQQSPAAEPNPAPQTKPDPQPAPSPDQNDTGPTTKRPVLRPIGSAPTIIKKPVPVGVRKEFPDPLAAPGTKKSTSRITLPASGGKSKTGEIRTIKIAPRSKTSNIDEQENSGEAQINTPQVVADPKKQTSRISLESVLGGDSANTPATIKIKRAPASQSSTLGTPTAEQAPDTSTDVAAEIITDDAPTQTKPESQKKTLKVRRAAVATGDRPDVSGNAQMFTPPVATMIAGEKEPHWTFALVALAATLVACVLLYVLTAQVIDKDLTVQPPPEPTMDWPARITVSR